MAASVTETTPKSSAIQILASKYRKPLDKAIAEVCEGKLIPGKTLFQLTGNRISFFIGSWSDDYKATRPYSLCSASVALKEFSRLITQVLSQPKLLTVRSQTLLMDCKRLLSSSLSIATVTDGWLLCEQNIKAFAHGDAELPVGTATVSPAEIEIMAQHIAKSVQELLTDDELHLPGGSYLHASQLAVHRDRYGNYSIYEYNTEPKWQNKAQSIIMLALPEADSVVDPKCWEAYIKDRITRSKHPKLSDYFLKPGQKARPAALCAPRHHHGSIQEENNCHLHSLKAWVKHRFVRIMGDKHGYTQYKVFNALLSRATFAELSDGLPAALLDYSAYVTRQRERHLAFAGLPFELATQHFIDAVSELSTQSAENCASYADPDDPLNSLNFLHHLYEQLLCCARPDPAAVAKKLEVESLASYGRERYLRYNSFLNEVLEITHAHLAYDASLPDRFFDPLGDHPSPPPELIAKDQRVILKTLRNAHLKKTEVQPLLDELGKLELFNDFHDALAPALLYQGLCSSLDSQVQQVIVQTFECDHERSLMWVAQTVGLALNNYQRVMAKRVIDSYFQLDARIHHELWHCARSWAYNGKQTLIQNLIEVSDPSKLPWSKLRAFIQTLAHTPWYQAQEHLDLLTQTLPNKRLKILNTFLKGLLDAKRSDVYDAARDYFGMEQGED